MYLCEDNYLSELTADGIRNMSGSRTKIRAQKLRPALAKVLPEGVFHYEVPSATEQNKVWNVAIYPKKLIRFSKEAKLDQIEDFDAVANEIVNGNLMIWCECPAYQLWGSSFLNSRMKVKLGELENRPITKNINPAVKGHGCKHALAALAHFKKSPDILAKHLANKLFDPQKVFARLNNRSVPKITNY